MQTFRAELHVHTVLSPCAEIEMIPPLIVEKALAQGIRLIAITDHNATGNIRAVQKAAEGSGLVVLPGMELQTREEVHNLCIFDTLEQALALQETVDAALPNLENQPVYFGEQLLTDENGDFVEREPRLLSTSANLSLDEACNLVRGLGGLFIPAHVDRKAFGLIQMLGLVPEDLHADALEISRHLKPSKAAHKFPQLKGFALIQSGDVHRLDEFMGVNLLQVENPTVAELRLALRQAEGRSHRILSSRKERFPGF